MQNKHKKFLVVGVPTFGEGGGVKPVGTKSQVWPKFFWTAPLTHLPCNFFMGTLLLIEM